MDLRCRTCVSEVEKGLHRCTHSQQFLPPKDDYSTDRCNRLCHTGYFSPYDSCGSHRPVNFYSRKYTGAEQNYDTYDLELLAIEDIVKQSHHHLEGVNQKLLLHSDYKNLKYFQTSKVQSRRQARWAEIVPSYDFVIEQQEGKKNPGDGQLRPPDYEISYENMTAKLLATLAATTVTKSYDDLLAEIKAAQESDISATEIRPTLLDISTADESQLRSIDGALTYKRWIYVPGALHRRVTSPLH